MTRPCLSSSDPFSSDDDMPELEQPFYPALLVPLESAAKTVDVLRKAYSSAASLSRAISVTLRSRAESVGVYQVLIPAEETVSPTSMKAGKLSFSSTKIVAEAPAAAIATYEHLFKQAKDDAAIKLRGQFLHFTEDSWVSSEATLFDCPLSSLASLSPSSDGSSIDESQAICFMRTSKDVGGDKLA